MTLLKGIALGKKAPVIKTPNEIVSGTSEIAIEILKSLQKNNENGIVAALQHFYDLCKMTNSAFLGKITLPNSLEAARDGNDAYEQHINVVKEIGTTIKEMLPDIFGNRTPNISNSPINQFILEATTTDKTFDALMQIVIIEPRKRTNDKRQKSQND